MCMLVSGHGFEMCCLWWYICDEGLDVHYCWHRCVDEAGQQFMY
jgi:hypothetical protein